MLAKSHTRDQQHASSSNPNSGLEHPDEAALANTLKSVRWPTARPPDHRARHAHEPQNRPLEGTNRDRPAVDPRRQSYRVGFGGHLQCGASRLARATFGARDNSGCRQSEPLLPSNPLEQGPISIEDQQ
jgi:hypothetical protein